MAQRIKWIDIARCLGIFAIYLSHFGEDAGKMYSFLYTHHVPLFFFLSGCLLPKKDLPLGAHIKKIADGLLLPWIVFALAAAAFDTIYMNSGLTYFIDLLKQIALGTIVNQFVAGGLWFLVCLAIMRLAFWFLRKLRVPALILAVCLLLFWTEANLPIPKYYNLHRVLRLMIYYAAGFYCFPLLSKALSPKTSKGRLLLSASGLVALAFSALVYFG